MAAPKRPPTVVVINSSQETVEALRNTFEDEGFNTASMHVDEIRKGAKDFVQFVEEHAPDAIVWDVAPPYEHNWNFLKLVRKAFPELTFIVSTTNKLQLEKLIGKSSEVIELVGKPYDLEQILDSVNRALKT